MKRSVDGFYVPADTPAVVVHGVSGGIVTIALASLRGYLVFALRLATLSG